MVPASSQCIAALCMGQYKDCSAQPAESQSDSHLPCTVSYTLCQGFLCTREGKKLKTGKVNVLIISHPNTV